MKAKRFTTSNERLKELREQNKTIENKTMFQFLIAHKGLRKNKMHLFVAPAGAGKSTLRNSLILDYAIYNPNKTIMLWLSEEKFEDFETDASKWGMKEGSLRNLIIYSEQDNIEPTDTVEHIRERFRKQVISIKPDLLIIDNITTSDLYSEKFDNQSVFAKEVKAFVQKRDIPLIVFCHASTNALNGQTKLLGMNDVRGSRGIVNLAEFMYLMQIFQVGPKTHSTLRTVKHRGQNVSSKIFGLEYNPLSCTYDKDISLNFEELKEIVKQMDRI